MIMALVYPVILAWMFGDGIVFAFQRHFQYLTAAELSRPQSLRRFLLQAAPEFREQLHRLNDQLLRQFIHLPDHGRG